MSVIVGRQLLEDEGKTLGNTFVKSNGAIVPVLRLDAAVEKLWSSGQNKKQTMAGLKKFFDKAGKAWHGAFKGQVPLKYVLAPKGWPQEALQMLQDGNLKVITPNVLLEQVAAAQPANINPESTLVMYHLTASKGAKNAALNTAVVNVHTMLKASGFTFVNADGFFNGVPVLQSKNAADVEKATTNNGKEILVDPAMVEGIVKLVQSVEQSVVDDIAVTPSPKDVVKVEKTATVPANTTVEVKTSTVTTTANNTTANTTTANNANNAEVKKVEHAEAPKKTTTTLEGENKTEGEKTATTPTDAEAEKAKKEAEATEEDGGISGATIAIIVVVVVAVLALLAVAYKKMKN